MAPNIYDMLATLSESIPSLGNLAIVFAYLSGLTMVIGALYKLRMHGDYRAMMSAGVDLKGPFGVITFGSFLIWLPSALEVTSASLWGVGEPLGYSPVGGSFYDEGIAVALQIVEFVGLVAFIRGLIILSRAGQSQQSQPGTFAKGFTHLIGGILAYHINATLDVLSNSLGI
jgi:hypothetical protein